MRLKALLAASFFLLSPLVARAEIPANLAAQMSPHPAMWVIKDADSTIYLFGSIHVMKDGVNWLTPAIRQRFESADDLWLEVPDLDNSLAMVQTAQKYMVNPANDMTRGLTPDEIKKLDDLLAPYGINSEKMQGTKKWAVGMFLALQQMQASGYAPKTGVDVTLLSGARYFNKRVHGFETIDEQMQFLAPKTDAEDLASLRAAIKDMSDGNADITALFQAWVAGDEASLSAYMVDKLKAEDPASYQRILVERNANWEPKIEEILKGKGTVFIAVGAGHLVGPDSVINMLKAHGIKAERLN